MKPKNKSTNCLPISSNCTVWEGPNIQCINLCKGDTVTDVVYKLALLICDLKSQLDLTDVDLTCLVQNCQLCNEPDSEIKVETVTDNVLKNIIKEVLSKNPEHVKNKNFGPLMGDIMKEVRGKVDGKKIMEVLKKELK